MKGKHKGDVHIGASWSEGFTAFVVIVAVLLLYFGLFALAVVVS